MKLEYIPTEEEEQKMLFEWAFLNSGRCSELANMFHITNEGKRSVRSGASLKAAGLLPGMPDICLPVPNQEYGALYIELKRQKYYTITQTQKERIRELNRLGNLAVVCCGFDEAKSVIENYLKIPRKERRSMSACLDCKKRKGCLASAHFHSESDECYEKET